jgi:hypothetical protein
MAQEQERQSSNGRSSAGAGNGLDHAPGYLGHEQQLDVHPHAGPQVVSARGAEKKKCEVLDCRAEVRVRWMMVVQNKGSGSTNRINLKEFLASGQKHTKKSRHPPPSIRCGNGVWAR